MIYCVCDTSQEWTSDVWTISCVRLSNKNQQTIDVLIAREKKKRRHVPIFSTLVCLHIHTSYWDLLFIHSLSLKQNKRVYLDNCSCSWLSLRVSRRRKKRKSVSRQKQKKILFSPSFFFYLFDNVLCLYMCLSKPRKKQIKNSSIGSNRLRLYTWQHQSIQHTFGLFDINNQTIGLPFLLDRSSTIVSFVSSFVVRRQSTNNI
jgi:hypothetical protein